MCLGILAIQPPWNFFPTLIRLADLLQRCFFASILALICRVLPPLIDNHNYVTEWILVSGLTLEINNQLASHENLYRLYIHKSYLPWSVNWPQDTRGWNYEVSLSLLWLVTFLIWKVKSKMKKKNFFVKLSDIATGLRGLGEAHQKTFIIIKYNTVTILVL